LKQIWIALLLSLISALNLSAQSEKQTATATATIDHSMHQGHDMQMQQGDDSDNPAAAAKRLADKQESEFNHHLAGFFVVLGGLFMLAQGWLTNRWSPTKYIWPLTFLLSGLFVMVWSDTELWPFHNKQWLVALQNDPEVLQHKTFAVLLLALGCIEWWRVTGRLNGVWARLVFPVLATGGSILLLFHRHAAGMHGPNHMELMARIQSEHMQYAVAGIGLGIAKALAEIKTRGQGVFASVWPVFMIGLGILLMFYTE
jgi:putative copper resistance protein D